MNLLERFVNWRRKPVRPVNLSRGELGERAARLHLEDKGLKFLTANFGTARGEIDLIFRDDDCLVFVEVKTRSSEAWLRPAAYVNAAKRRRLSKCAMDYLTLLRKPQIKIRFDVV